MALSRKLLKGMGLTDEQVDTIIEAHTDTVDGLKDEIGSLKAAAKELPEIKAKLKTALEELETAKKDGWKDKHDAVKKEFDQYKADQTAKEQHAAKESAAREFYKGKNIVGSDLDFVMKYSQGEISGLELDESGKIKDTAKLDALVAGDFSRYVSKTVTKGADTASPPNNNGGGTMTKADIMAITDRTQRRIEMAKHKELFSGGN